MTAAPALCDGLVIVPSGGGLLVEGGPRRQSFTGATATTVLPRLLPLLDGRHDGDRLAAELGLTTSQVDQMLGLLGDSGLLDRKPIPAGAGLAEEVRRYYSRALGSAGGYPGSADLLAALRQSRVIVVDGDGVLGPLASDLRDCGLTVAVAADPDELADANVPGSLAVVYDSGPAGMLERAVQVCARSGRPVLRVAAGGETAEIGPVFRLPWTACAGCLRHAAADAGGPALGTDEGSDLARELMCGLAADEILAQVAHVRPPMSSRHLTRVVLGSLTTTRWLVAPSPDCPACGPGWHDAGDAAVLAETYEWRYRHRLAEREWHAEPPAEQARRLHDLQISRPIFPTSPRHRLPGEADLPAVAGVFGEPVAGARLHADVLAAILLKAVGRRDDPAASPRRGWAPSGGNLASAAAYVITGQRPYGLPGTCFRYDDLAHELVALCSDQLPLAEVMAGTDLDPDGLDAAVVLVAEIGRLAGKYEGFAWRLAHLDAGCAAMQLSAVAAGHGIDVTFASSWDEHLGELLELSPRTEVVTVVAALRGLGGKDGRKGHAPR